jgi:hypothetical protein
VGSARSLSCRPISPANPTSPYHSAVAQKPFGTFGGPDIAAVLAQVARCALNAVWYQKWVVHLRHRPEAGAGLVHLIKGGASFDATPDPFVFHSKAEPTRLHWKSEMWGTRPSVAGTGSRSLIFRLANRESAAPTARRGRRDDKGKSNASIESGCWMGA